MAADRREIAIIGAGWSGLAAAVETVSRGASVTVFEMAPKTGGRARSISSGTSTHNEQLDNGQHILIGAYVECLRLMERVGVDTATSMRRMPLLMVGPDGNGLRLAEGPALLTFVRAVLSRRGWRFRERIALLVEASGWLIRGFRCRPDLTVGALTARLPRRVREQLIDPLCVAALNTSSDAASALVFLRVLHDALFTSPGSSDLLLPRAPLDDLFPKPACAWLRARGAELRLSTRVETLIRDGSGWSIDGRRFDAVVIASSAVESARLVAPHDPAWSAHTEGFAYEPIVTVYADCDGARLPEPMLMLASNDFDQPAQFVFDQGQLGGPPGRISFVVSGAARWIERGVANTTEATLEQARSQLSNYLPSMLRHVRTLTEKRATFRCLPELHRPRADILPALVAAGDYVAGPYPATLEGAVRSGIQAADSIFST